MAISRLSVYIFETTENSKSKAAKKCHIKNVAKDKEIKIDSGMQKVIMTVSFIWVFKFMFFFWSTEKSKKAKKSRKKKIFQLSKQLKKKSVSSNKIN